MSVDNGKARAPLPARFKFDPIDLRWASSLSGFRNVYLKFNIKINKGDLCKSLSANPIHGTSSKSSSASTYFFLPASAHSAVDLKVWSSDDRDRVRRAWWFLIHTSPDRCEGRFLHEANNKLKVENWNSYHQKEKNVQTSQSFFLSFL